MLPITKERNFRRFSIGLKAAGYGGVLVAAAHFPTPAILAGIILVGLGALFVFVAAFEPVEK
jgi:hypothetical protein